MKNECKFLIPSESLTKIPSRNENISYTLESLIMYDGNSLDCGHYGSVIFDFNKVIWWNCDDDDIIEVSYWP